MCICVYVICYVCICIRDILRIHMYVHTYGQELLIYMLYVGRSCIHIHTYTYVICICGQELHTYIYVICICGQELLARASISLRGNKLAMDEPDTVSRATVSRATVSRATVSRAIVVSSA